jgi:N-acetylglutamate synthase-like GNAT family acetyltransferase
MGLELMIRYATKDDVAALKKMDPAYQSIGKRIKDQTPVVVACMGETIAGYLVYDLMPECYFFDHVFVAPEYRGNLIGSALMKMLTSKVGGGDDGVKRLFIMTIVDDFLGEGIDKARFLRKIGFNVVSYLGEGAILHYERPEVNVARIVASDRMKPWFPESLHYEVDDDSEI